jgi:hypothetical protein
MVSKRAPLARDDLLATALRIIDGEGVDVRRP